LNTPGSLTFFDDPSVIVNNTNGRYPQGFQTPGIVQTMTLISGTEAAGTSNKAWSAAAYVQDDWKVTSRFTVNLGIRYDVEPGRGGPPCDRGSDDTAARDDDICGHGHSLRRHYPDQVRRSEARGLPLSPCGLPCSEIVSDSSPYISRPGQLADRAAARDRAGDCMGR